MLNRWICEVNLIEIWTKEKREKGEGRKLCQSGAFGLLALGFATKTTTLPSTTPFKWRILGIQTWFTDANQPKKRATKILKYSSMAEPYFEWLTVAKLQEIIKNRDLDHTTLS